MRGYQNTYQMLSKRPSEYGTQTDAAKEITAITSKYLPTPETCGIVNIKQGDNDNGY